jgi:PBP1b-binding outer membrane lipoprotein LpoB
MNMKKWLSVIAAVLLMVLLFTACSSGYFTIDDVEKESPNTPEAVEEQA